MMISNEIEWLIDIYAHSHQQPTADNVEKIKLSQLVSKLGFFYEKFRNAIDYNEEHLVRRNAIDRIIRRQVIFLQESRPHKISKTLIYEFIRAGYLPNDQLPETIIGELARIIDKYLIIVNYIFGRQLPQAKKLASLTLGIASCEINEFLSPVTSRQDEAAANLMYSHLVEHLNFANSKIDPKEQNLQIYIAVLKNLNKADLPALRYALLKLYAPNWHQFSETEIKTFCHNISIIYGKINKHLSHPIAFQLSHTIKTQAVFFLIIKDLISQHPKDIQQIIANEETMEDNIEELVANRQLKIKSKLIGTIFRVIVYIFFTKTILAFILELPYDIWIAQHINWRALIINITFHPALMFVMAMAIHIPGPKNTKIIVEEIKKIVYQQERNLIFKPKKIMKKGTLSYYAFNLIYSIMFGVSFGLIVYLLRLLNFNILSGVLFIFFLTIVSFFAFRLRYLAKQLLVLPRKDNLLGFIIDFLSLPIVRVGRFLSTNFSRVNVFLYILDFIIETPFKMLIEFLEKTMSFINDKREEIIE